MTIEEFIEKATGNKALQEAFVKAKDEKRLDAFFKEQGIGGTPEEIMQFLKEKKAFPLTDEELEGVSAGLAHFWDPDEVKEPKDSVDNVS